MQAMSDEERRHRILGGVSRSRLMSLMGESREWQRVSGLAQQVGLHPNTTREHLDQLVGAGLVERQRTQPSGRGRPSFRYRTVHRVDERAAYRALAAVLAAELSRGSDGQAIATAAGERWGKALVESDEVPTNEPLARMTELLDELGFAPSLETSDGGADIKLRRCPFFDLARSHGKIVCSVHLGLMRGALSELHSPLDAVSLEPFVEPDLCLAQVVMSHAAG
jgi:predicted ArsR family transcriptional regulator